MTCFIVKARALIMCALILLTAALMAGSAYADDFASCYIPVTCKVCESIPVDVDLDFTYMLEADSDDCPMPEGSVGRRKTVHMTDSGKVNFGKIRFDRPEVFRYTLKETTRNTGRFRRDDSVYHTTLVADTDGSVNIIVNNDDGEKPDKIEFVNKYMTAKTGIREGSPKTGDGSRLSGYAVLLAVCGAAVLMLFKKRRRRREHARRAVMCAASVIALFFAAAGWQSVYAGAYPVDTVNSYNDMPGNYVEISHLNFRNAEFTAINSKIVKGQMQYLLSGEAVTHDTIYWKSRTAPQFGAEDPDAMTINGLGQTALSGDIFKLRFSGAATLPDGSKKDVLMVFSNLIIALSDNVNGTTGTNYYYPIIRITEGGSGRYCNSGIGTGTTNAKRIIGVRSATRIMTTVSIVEPGTETPIPEKNYILGFRDLDVKDNTVSAGSDEYKYACLFSEGIGLISGFNEPVFLTPNTHIRQDNWNGTPKFRGTQSENGSLNGGFDISVKSTGFTYYWYGSHNMPASGNSRGGAMGTAFGYSPKVKVLATASEGGTIEKEGCTEYLVNTSTTYDYAPAPGYRVKRLAVDGTAVEYNRTGGTYTFDKLVQTDNSDYDHTIEVSFEPPTGIVVKNNVKGNLGDRKKKFKYLLRFTGLIDGGEFQTYGSSDGVFPEMGMYGEKLSSGKFKPDSNGIAELVLYLKDDESFSVDGLLTGARYMVRQYENDHTASYQITGDGTSPVITKAHAANTGPGLIRTDPEAVDSGDGLVTVQFTNQKDLAPPTGVRNSSMPLAAAAFVIAVTLVLLLLPLVISVVAARRMLRRSMTWRRRVM